MKNIYLIITLLCMQVVGYAQVGVNQNNPNHFAILELKSTEKGVLFPRMTTAERFAIKNNCNTNNNCPDGLTVFDTDQQTFFYMDNKVWHLLNPFLAPDYKKDTAEDIQNNTNITQNLGIGTVPSTNKKLDVNGAVKIRDGSRLNNQLKVTNGERILTEKYINYSGNVTASKHIKVPKGVVESKNFSTSTAKTGNGPAPMGAIIIWSGTVASIPKGWALCDGKKGTPDLRAKFVVGVGDNSSVDGNAYNAYDEGGKDSITLTIDEMPSHSHSATTGIPVGTGIDGNGNHTHEYKGYETPVYYTCAGSDDFDVLWRYKDNNNPNDYFGDDAGAHTHTSLDLAESGNDKPHENRPPFYALAFIMKL